MLLSACSAKALAAIALCSMLGPEELKARLPFRVISSGSYWVVRGRLGPESRTKPFFRDFHVYIDKSTAEMRGLAAGGMKPFKIPPSTMRILRDSGWRRRSETHSVFRKTHTRRPLRPTLRWFCTTGSSARRNQR